MLKGRCDWVLNWNVYFGVGFYGAKVDLYRVHDSIISIKVLELNNSCYFDQKVLY